MMMPMGRFTVEGFVAVCLGIYGIRLAATEQVSGPGLRM